jgi:hypothetical protein
MTRLSLQQFCSSSPQTPTITKSPFFKTLKIKAEREKLYNTKSKRELIKQGRKNYKSPNVRIALLYGNFGIRLPDIRIIISKYNTDYPRSSDDVYY